MDEAYEAFRFEPPRLLRMVGSPSLSGLWKGCPSSGSNQTAVSIRADCTGVFQCGSRCAKNLFSHSFAAESNSLNSGFLRSFTSSGSVCRASQAQ